MRLISPRGDQERKALEIILDYHHTGSMAAGATDQSLPTSTPTTPGGTNGSIGPGQYVEMLGEEFWPPFNSQGQVEDLRARYLTLDSTMSTQSWLYLSGRADLNTSPPINQNAEGEYLTILGGGILSAVQVLAAGPRPGEDRADVMGRAFWELAVPRAAASVVHNAQAGASTVTGDWHSRWWGRRWTAAEIVALARMVPGGAVFGGKVRVRRPWFNNGQGLTVEFEVPQVALTPENWTQLAGGPAQSGPYVFPFRRWAINAQATDGQGGEYPFSYSGASGSNVGVLSGTSIQDSNQNLDFNYAVGTASQGVLNNVLLLDGWGVQPLLTSADSAFTDLTVTANQPPTASQYLKILGDAPSQIHPNNGLPCKVGDNPQQFGLQYPSYSAAAPLRYKNLRRGGMERQIIVRARAYLAMRDALASVPAYRAGAAAEGLLFQGYQNARVS